MLVNLRDSMYFERDTLLFHVSFGANDSAALQAGHGMAQCRMSITA